MAINHFTLITDHQPLVSILHPDNALPSVTEARLQRYALLLSEYTFHIWYRSTHCHGNADAISRLPLTEATEVERQDREELDDCPEFRLNQLEQIPVTTAVLRDATAKDSVLSRVLKYIQVGWPVDIPEELKSFRDKRGELAPEQGCLLLGIRVVIPASLQRKVLDEIHGGHLGVVKMTCMVAKNLPGY